LGNGIDERFSFHFSAVSLEEKVRQRRLSATGERDEKGANHAWQVKNKTFPLSGNISHNGSASNEKMRETPSHTKVGMVQLNITLTSIGRSSVYVG